MKPSALPEQQQQPPEVLNFVLVGPSNAGKSTMIRNCLVAPHKAGAGTNLFDAALAAVIAPTVGPEFHTITRVKHNRRYACRVWDTPGQTRFDSLTHSYFRNTHGVIFMVDLHTLIAESAERMQTDIGDGGSMNAMQVSTATVRPMVERLDIVLGAQRNRIRVDTLRERPLLVVLGNKIDLLCTPETLYDDILVRTVLRHECQQRHGTYHDVSVLHRPLQVTQILDAMMDAAMDAHATYFATATTATTAAASLSTVALSATATTTAVAAPRRPLAPDFDAVNAHRMGATYQPDATMLASTLYDRRCICTSGF